MKYKEIKRPSDCLMIPIEKENPNPIEIELNNLYSYITWHNKRLEQLEKLIQTKLK
jgi:hypothetical protein